jgi:yeast amino acid transporter
MAAFEASPKSDRRFLDLAWASRWAHWVIVSLYFLYTLGVALSVHWLDPRLSTVYGIDPRNMTATDISYNLGKVADFVHNYYTNSTVIIAMQSDDGHSRNSASVSFVNVCLIFCVMSAANTSLYIASRTLWGIARHAVSGHSPLRRLVKKLAGIWESTSVPGVSLIASLVAILSWYPGAQFAASSAKDVSNV